MTKLAVYPGTFDPITNGHMNIIQRALAVFDELDIAIAINPRKAPLFTVEERVTLIRDSLVASNVDMKRIHIHHLDGLLVDYAAKVKAQAIVRGLRAVSDFEYEFQMASINRKLNPTIETFFMMTDEGHFYISSQTVKEVAFHQGCVKGLVPATVEKQLHKKYGVPSPASKTYCKPKE